MRWSWGTLVVVVAALSCSDDDPGLLDAAVDPPEPVELVAEPDPDELTECQTTPPADGVARAKHVSCADELLSGAPALGRVGDLVIENSRVRFIIRGADTSAMLLGAYGGGVLDAGVQGGVDLVNEIMPAFDLAAGRPTDIVVTDAGGDGDASIRVLFESAPVGLISALVPGLDGAVRARGAVDYELRAGEDALRVTTTITTREGVAGAQGRPMLLAIMGAAEMIQPGLQLLMDADGPGGDGRATYVAETDEAGLAVRLLPDSGGVSHVLSLNIVAAADRVTVMEGSTITSQARIGVGATAADAWNAAHEDESWPAVTITGAVGDRVAIEDTGGAPWIRTRYDAGGSARVRLPPDDYRAVAGYAGFFSGTPVPVALGSDAAVTVPTAPRGTLRVDITAGGDDTAPVMVAIEDGADLELRRVVFGDGVVELPPGDYVVTVARGHEYELHQQSVTLAEGAEVPVTATLGRVVDTTGWVAGDFHLHTEMSTDSTQGTYGLLRLLAANGIEVVASLDHDFINDHPGHLEAAGVAGHMIAVRGAETSSTIIGHTGGYPLAIDGAADAMGAPNWFDASPSEVFGRTRAAGDEALGGAIVQLNHPRFEGSSFFDQVALDRDTGRATADPETLGLPPGTDLDDFDFDVVEVWNGISGSDAEESFEDWLALHAAGRPFPMVGNSDTHRPTMTPGSPRTLVQVPDDTAGAFDWSEVATALRAGQATISSGIFVTATVAGPAAGDVVPVAVRVQAPPWVSVDRLRIYAGRSVAVERPITTDPAMAVRLDETIDVPLGGASFVVVRADGSERARPVLRSLPFGVTNALPIP